MASVPAGTVSQVSLRHGIRCVPAQGVTVEDVLLAIGEKVGYENITTASRMNKAVVVFVEKEDIVNQLISDGIVVSGDFLIISPLVAPTTRVTISNVPPFIRNDEIEKALSRYGKKASEIKMIPLGCKNAALKHVMSFRRQVFMFLNEPELDISFRVMHEGKAYFIYANTGSLKCFECGDIGHKRHACPHKAQVSEVEVRPSTSTAGESSKSASEDVQPQAGSQRNIDSNGVSESQTENVHEMVDSGKNNDISELEDASVLNDDVATVSVERVFNENSEMSNSGEMCDADSGMRDDDAFSDMSDIGSQCGSVDDVYKLQDINNFLDETFGRTVEVKEFFPDENKFMHTVKLLQRNVSFDVLSKQKRFRLKKMLTKLRRDKINVSQNKSNV